VIAMTRKDYELIAAAIRMQVDSLREGQPSTTLSLIAVQECAVKIAGALMRENQRFDYTRFLTACGF
jgi:hypothetical protein